MRKGERGTGAGKEGGLCVVGAGEGVARYGRLATTSDYFTHSHWTKRLR